jgi:hypothetical protein
MDSALEARLQYLVSHQNADGGWSYYPGRASWLEPTAWAVIALHGQDGFGQAWERGWERLRSWQLSDGGCRPSAVVNKSTWVTALWVTAHCVAGIRDNGFNAAVDWLLDARGTDGALWRRLLWKVTGRGPAQNADFYGWSWFPGTHSWIEPTVHTMVALKLAARGGHRRAGEIASRTRIGEQMLLDRRCADGGWNYGASRALDIALPSYPECTGLALTALQDTAAAREQAGREASRDLPASPLANAWIRIALALHGNGRSSTAVSPRHSADLAVEALAALSEPGGNVPLLATRESS